MTNFRFRMMVLLVLAAALWPATALALEQQAQEPAAQDTAAVPTGPTAIPAAEIAQRITKIRDRGITVLLVEHDMSLVMDISDPAAPLLLVLGYVVLLPAAIIL